MSASAAAAAAQANAATASGAVGPHCPADRLALFMQRHQLTDERVAQQLRWNVDDLRAYLAPDNRKQKAMPDQADTAVEQLLARFQIMFARQILVNATAKPLTPVLAYGRRTSTPTQFTRNALDRKSIICAEPDPSKLSSSSDWSTTSPNNRKRKRKVVAKQLATEVTVPVRTKAASDMMCPIRIDVDVNGTRYQDTFLLNAGMATLSPDTIAMQIAQDEQFCESVKDAIAESIRRQLVTFTSFASADLHVAESLHPIYLDLIIDGLALRDQLEWDISNDFSDIQAFANSLCTDMNLPTPFEGAIVFSICEQVSAYRRAIYAHRWIGNDPMKAAKLAASRTAVTAASGYIDIMPPVDENVLRDTEEAKLWQPTLSELSKEEQQYLSTRLAAARRSSLSSKAKCPR
uniref:Uncharacterized protein n=1 Tax=Globisporangium ultimum (strain ATCC 200006 / CBS 805.95 / DAOM BR144) TaxID=431595 RepID=K3WUV3_GLOUD